jgi:ABC-2 type transport system permease protein
MKHFLSLLRHEIRTLFIAPATYTAAVLFLILMGLIYHGILRQYTLDEQTVDPAYVFFQIFWIPVLFMVPLLTMRSIAEERRMGTLETLMTTPVTAAEIVLSKFLASWFFYCLLWLCTLSFPLIIQMTIHQEPVTQALLSKGPLIGGYLFTFLSGTLFIAVGIFSSSLTRSQLVAGMLSFSILFILILGPRLLQMQGVAMQIEWLQASVDYLQLFTHLEDFSRGMLDSRPFFYYLSNTGLVLGVSILMVESKA